MSAEEAAIAASASGLEMVTNPRTPRIATRAAGCPFHINNACSIYDSRPSGCRAYVCTGGEDPFDQHPEFAKFYGDLMSGQEAIADVRDWFPEPISETIARHERIALQFSGGKDSIATLMVMRPWWDKLTVYWTNTGDPFPEVLEVANRVRGMVPHFVEIAGNRDFVVEQFGLPSDVIPYSSTSVSHAMGVGETVLLQDRFSCCARSIMLPMHARMVKDGITLIVRGQRDAEVFKGPYRSGDIGDGVELLYPIEQWTDEQVFSFIQENGFDVPRYYTEGMPHSGDCLVCTAWVGDGRGSYLRAHYPERFAEYREKLAIVGMAAKVAVNNLINEIEVCHG